MVGIVIIEINLVIFEILRLVDIYYELIIFTIVKEIKFKFDNFSRELDIVSDIIVVVKYAFVFFFVNIIWLYSL